MTAQQSPSRFQIPPEIEAKMTPAAKAFVEAGLSKYWQRIAEFGNQVRLLADQLQELIP
jgi:hypothetical protein